MIQASDFVLAAQALGFDFYSGVPCSYLKPFINYVIDDPDIQYVAAANEGDAVASATGAALGGRRAIAMMQNSGLGNAVSPLTSLNWVFRLPVLLIVTWRGKPGQPDEPQHELMGQITQNMLETMDIPWRIFPRSADEIAAALETAVDYMDRSGRAYALVMEKGSVAPHELQTAPPSPKLNRQLQEADFRGQRSSRTQALAAIQSRTPADSSIVIGSTGYTGRELFALDDRPNQLYMVGSMGCASSLALGLAMCTERRIVVVDGDGAALMRMGNLATLGAYGPDNLVHILLDNEVHDSTGGQGTVSAGVHFARVAAASGYDSCLSGTDISLLDRLMSDGQGVRFAHLKIRPGAPAQLPRPNVSPAQVKTRLMNHLGISAPWREIHA